MTAEELERVLLAKQGENMSDSAVQGPNRVQQGGKRALGSAVKKGGMLLKGKNPNNVRAPQIAVLRDDRAADGLVQITRQEEDVRTRMSTTSDIYRKAVLETQTVRQEYFNFQLPRILRVCQGSFLKACG